MGRGTIFILPVLAQEQVLGRGTGQGEAGRQGHEGASGTTRWELDCALTEPVFVTADSWGRHPEARQRKSNED